MLWFQPPALRLKLRIILVFRFDRLKIYVFNMIQNLDQSGIYKHYKKIDTDKVYTVFLQLTLSQPGGHIMPTTLLRAFWIFRPCNGPADTITKAYFSLL